MELKKSPVDFQAVEILIELFDLSYNKDYLQSI